MMVNEKSVKFLKVEVMAVVSNTIETCAASTLT
jgi:hypothetical protein